VQAGVFPVGANVHQPGHQGASLVDRKPLDRPRHGDLGRHLCILQLAMTVESRSEAVDLSPYLHQVVDGSNESGYVVKLTVQ